MINVTLVGERELVAKLQRMPRGLHDVLRRRISSLVMLLKARVQRKLSGEVLNVRTGALRRSIQAEVLDEGNAIWGRVFSTGDVKYAGIHEFGGKTPAHIIEPRNGSVLAFMMGGSMVFARRVHHPGSVMPERSFMRSSLREMREQIISTISDGLLEAAAGGKP